MENKKYSLQAITGSIIPLNTHWVTRAQERTAQLVMPTRALGRLHSIAEQICAIQETLTPEVQQKAVLIMAGDHGVVDEGVSAYPQVITAEMVRTFIQGGAGINAITRHVGAEVWVVDMGIISDVDPGVLDEGNRMLVHKVARGTANFTKGPAMSPQAAKKAVLTGFCLATELFDKGVQIIGTGDMGIGNTTPSAAVGSVITGLGLDEIVGRGTGVDDEGLLRKKDAIRRGIDQNRPDPRDGLDVLSKIGGFEIGAIAGCILAGAFHRRPVVIDGFISTAGALVACALCPPVVDYLLAGHCSQESGHAAMLRYLGLEPILDLGMRLGEGTGAALAMSIIDGAIRVFNEVMTFKQANVTDKS